MKKDSGLLDLYNEICGIETREIVNNAESMRIFANGDSHFIIGQWKAWEAECRKQGEYLDPSAFKEKPLAQISAVM